MLHAHSHLGRALVLSLILHAMVIAAFGQFSIPAPMIAPQKEPDIKVTMRLEPAVPDTPPLILPQPLPPRDTASNPIAAAPAARKTASAPLIAGEAALSAAEQLQRELLYPREAIERGLEGEVLVLLFLDASGNAVAARIESSSGHALLDEAAVRAARTLRALPDSAPRDVVLQVRFRLR